MMYCLVWMTCKCQGLHSEDAKAMFGIHPALMTFNPAPLNYTIQAKILHYTSKILSPRIFKTSILDRGHKFSMDSVNCHPMVDAKYKFILNININ